MGWGWFAYKQHSNDIYKLQRYTIHTSNIIDFKD